MSKRPSTTPFEDEQFLLYLLAATARRVMMCCENVYSREFGIYSPRWRLLAQIGRFGSISASEVCQLIAMDRVTISRAASQCIADGLILERPSQTDRRSKLLTLTPKGRALYEAVVPRAVELAALIESGLTTHEAHTLKRLLSKLDAHVEQMVRTKLDL